MAEEIGGEDGVAPGGEVDADLLEEPAGVGSVAMGHEDRGLDLLIQGQEALREELAVGGVEVGLGVAHPLRRVVLLLRHVPPEVRGRLCLYLFPGHCKRETVERSRKMVSVFASRWRWCCSTKVGIRRCSS